MTRLSDTYIKNREMVQPHHASPLETAHGGNVLKWMDEVGAMAAMRFAGQPCVTAHINGVDFERPVQVGDTALLHAYVYDAGRTSVRVRVKVFRENPMTGETERTTESYVIYVAIDEHREPSPVPAVEIETEREKELQAAAKAGEPSRI